MERLKAFLWAYVNEREIHIWTLNVQTEIQSKRKVGTVSTSFLLIVNGNLENLTLVQSGYEYLYADFINEYLTGS